MFYHHFDMLSFQTTKDDNHEPEVAKTGQPNLLDKLLAWVASALFPEVAEVDTEDEVMDSGQPESNPVIWYSASCSAIYDIGVYWIDF